jgi:hypothetical protein
VSRLRANRASSASLVLRVPIVGHVPRGEAAVSLAVIVHQATVAANVAKAGLVMRVPVATGLQATAVLVQAAGAGVPSMA